MHSITARRVNYPTLLRSGVRPRHSVEDGASCFYDATCTQREHSGRSLHGRQFGVTHSYSIMTNTISPTALLVRLEAEPMDVTHYTHLYYNNQVKHRESEIPHRDSSPPYSVEDGGFSLPYC